VGSTARGRSRRHRGDGGSGNAPRLTRQAGDGGTGGPSWVLPEGGAPGGSHEKGNHVRLSLFAHRARVGYPLRTWARVG
jgi:hypothetical protein